MKAIYLFFLLLPFCISLAHAAQKNNYTVSVSNGPFAKELVLSAAQHDFSPWWKKSAKAELEKPVNFAGKYRLFVSPGGHGKECLHDYWICGWVIDKITGEVVSTLPTSPEGGNSYAEAVDNGTPDGVKFKVISSKNLTSLTIIGRAVNAPLRDENGDFSVPECRAIKYNFDGGKYAVIKEENNGCNLPREAEVYGR